MAHDSKTVRVQGWIISTCEDIAARERLSRPEVFRMLVRRGIEDYESDRDRQHNKPK
jgi:hypothetical protein